MVGRGISTGVGVGKVGKINNSRPTIIRSLIVNRVVLLIVIYGPKKGVQ